MSTGGFEKIQHTPWHLEARVHAQCCVCAGPKLLPLTPPEAMCKQKVKAKAETETAWLRA